MIKQTGMPEEYNSAIGEEKLWEECIREQKSTSTFEEIRSNYR